MSENDSHIQDPTGTSGRAASTSGQEAATPSSDTAHSSEQDERGGRISRFAGESRALFDDLREWVDLRVQLVQVEIEERIEKMANEAISLIMVAVVGLFAVAFLLHGLAIWISDALGAQQWGYLIMALVLGLITVILKTAKPDFVGKRQENSVPELKAPVSGERQLGAVSKDIEGLTQPTAAPQSEDEAQKESEDNG